MGVILSAQAGLPETIFQIKPSIVGVGTVLPMRQPPGQLLGTGFVVGDGHYVVTNAHVVPSVIDENNKEFTAIFIGEGKRGQGRRATLIKIDKEHDLALLRVEGEKLAAMQLGEADAVLEGQEYAFTGFPIGAVLGLYPVTHRGIISAILPIATPVSSTKDLDIRMIRRLRNPYHVFQLDATAYSGNSGSPLYNISTGRVVGVVNKVFVKETKKTVLEKPSAISYAIPVTYVRELLKSANVSF